MKQARRLCNAIGGLLFVALFLVFVVQISARFGWGQPLPWTDEAAVILYIWVILWSAALVVAQQEHVAFDLIWNAAGPRTRVAMACMGNLLLGGLALVAIPATWDYVYFMRREGTPVLDVPYMWVFLPMVFLLMALVVRSAWNLWMLARNRFQPVAGATP